MYCTGISVGMSYSALHIDSDFAWQIQSYAAYWVSKLFQTTTGYWILGKDYDNRTDAKYLMDN